MTSAEIEIPKTYKACIYDDPGKISTKVVELETPEPGNGQVLVHLTHSGVCHSDLGVMKRSWAGLPHPTPQGQVGGHEGVGTVVKLGPGAEKGVVQVGDRVGIKWIASVCGSCLPCLEDADGLCFKQKISGYYHPGTFQQYVLGPANYVTPIPDGLSSAEVAPFLCAGVTTYSALRKTKAKSGQWVVISGAGGGLGHLAVQMASRGFAYRVIGIDDASKETLVKESGAEHFVDLTKHTDESIAAEVKRLAGGLGASAVVVCTGNNRAYAQALDFLRFRGTLVCVGMPEGEPVPIAKSFPARLVGRETRIVASAVGNRKEAIETLEMAARGIVKTHYRVEKMDKLTEVFQEMEEGKLVGRIVIDLQ